VHKYLAETVEELGVQDRTVAISPVGCSVFLYYYLDVGHSQAAHGRAPAVALGHKLANPEAIVVSYQGDGDLASIGLAEILQAAQLGMPLSVIFVNNAVYGMTGGQLAPTTLVGQKTATTPYGRGRFEGEPLRMAELVAQLDGPAYVERVALFDAKQRVRAKKAIRKAIQLQAEKRGFAFVEVLAECPTHWHLDPAASEKWVKEKMLPVFPLGVRKDVARDVGPPWHPPRFDAAELSAAIGADGRAVKRHGSFFPASLFGPDIAIKLAGAGGDGAQTAALLLARAAVNEGWDATHIPSYGPESRGGTSYADVRIAEHEVLSPAVPRPNILVAFNAPSLDRFAGRVQAGGVVLFDSSVAAAAGAGDPAVRTIGVPFARIASELGNVKVKSVVALGALQQATRLFPAETFLAAIEQALREKGPLLSLNRDAFARGVEAAGAAAGATT
jgi:2-oxoisovalerate ferredoxin oxidoreductase beta subunit